MNPQFEFVEEALHVLAQPVTALHAALELGLSDHAKSPEARKVFEDCLGILDRLTQELAVFREIASLDAEPPLELCDGKALLKSCVEEMAPVAEASGVALNINADKVRVECNASMLQRAVFLLLDEMIACAPPKGISIRLRKGLNTRRPNVARLEFRPGTAPGRRQQLCRKLMQFAGASGISFDSSRTYCCFRKGESLQVRQEGTGD